MPAHYEKLSEVIGENEAIQVAPSPIYGCEAEIGWDEVDDMDLWALFRLLWKVS